MFWLLRRGKSGVIHAAVKEGGGSMILMMTMCGRQVRWDQPHEPWQRAELRQGESSRAHVTCKRCLN